MTETHPTLFERIRAEIHKSAQASIERIVPEASLREDLGADSLDRVELAIAIELEFDIEVTDDDVDALHTVADVVALVERRQRAA